MREKLNCLCQPGEARFRAEQARETVERQFENPGALPPGRPWAMQAAGALMGYLHETQKTDLSYINHLEYYAADRFMELDLTARRNLELTETLRGKEKKGSLLWVLDKTRTAMGGRKLRQWLESPLLSPVEINGRLNAVANLVDNLVVREELLLTLREVTDLERLIGRIVYGNTNCKDLQSLGVGLSKVPRIRELLDGLSSPLLQGLSGALCDLTELREKLEAAIVDEPPFLVREGGMIREGFNEEVDYLNHVLNDSKSLIADIEAREREKTGIRQLRVRYNKVFGYYIEVPRAQAIHQSGIEGSGEHHLQRKGPHRRFGIPSVCGIKGRLRCPRRRDSADRRRRGANRRFGGAGGCCRPQPVHHAPGGRLRGY